MQNCGKLLLEAQTLSLSLLVQSTGTQCPPLPPHLQSQRRTLCQGIWCPPHQWHCQGNAWRAGETEEEGREEEVDGRVEGEMEEERGRGRLRGRERWRGKERQRGILKRKREKQHERIELRTQYLCKKNYAGWSSVLGAIKFSFTYFQRSSYCSNTVRTKHAIIFQYVCQK